jgi:type III restriction enzyme
MAIRTLKAFQESAVASAVAVFEHARELYDAAGADEVSRATAIHGSGYLLIEAPTGAGKTLMAGHIVEKMSGIDRVVWFWFAPFKGVVDQTSAFLRGQYQGIRLRALSEDRNGIGTRTGDVFVTTWSLVATRVRDRRSVRQSGEQNGSVDDLIVSLREQGFRIGVVVDEAHHGFHGDTQAAAFFRGVLKPDYTILVTATPDDADLRDLQERMQLGYVQRISISRTDVVAAGLIKDGIKCIAWRTDPANAALVDFEGTALREGTALHRSIKAALRQAGVNLVPLMLVQVTDSVSVGRARERLVALGFTEGQIATHTADEPDAGLMSLANDETREVLIFKMAVALGFDAPRAWTLVSMRAARDEDFGVQLVGRILRVHRRLQGRTVADMLRYGYVLLADSDAQTGIDTAGQRINRLQTAYATISPTTIIVQVGNQTQVQVVTNGQTVFFSAPPEGALWQPPAEVGPAGRTTTDEVSDLFTNAATPIAAREAVRAALLQPPPAASYQYELREGMPRIFKTQDFPEDIDVSEEDCAARFVVSAEHLLDTILGRDRVRVEKRTLEIFTSQIQMELGFALPSLEQMQHRAQRELMRSGIFSAKELRRALTRRLGIILAARGVEDATNHDRLNQYLDVLLSQHPELLRSAAKEAMAATAEIRDAGEIPGKIDSEVPLAASARNVYGCMPPGLNSWETEFGAYMDSDDTGSVLWWHRNPPRKPWSINVLLEDGRGFYPDFLVGINGRRKEQNGLLADTKYAWDTGREIPKMLAEHASYGRVVILTKDLGRWAIADVGRTGRPTLVGPFRLFEAATL